VTTLRASAITLEAPTGLVAYADGEHAGPLPLTVEAHRESLTLCVPV
jgi:diacylglycerol kinase (ATP)